MPRSSIRRCSWRRSPRPRKPHMTGPADGARDGAFMRIALGPAVRARTLIAPGGTRPTASHDPTAHAEIQALRAGAQALGNYRLNDTTLYVTLEPCVMCASAIVHARVRRLVFGAWDARAGGAGSITNVFTLPGLNHRVDVFGGVLMDDCARLLQEFFVQRRE